MIKPMMLVLTVSVALSFTVRAAVADDLQAVEKKICEQWQQRKSMTAKMTMEMRMEQPGMTMESIGEGTNEMLRKGDKILSRMELKNNMVQKVGDQEMKMSSEVITIIDGDFAYTLQIQNRMDQQIKTAFKTNIDPQMSGDPKLMFEQLAKDNELELAPEETVDGRKVFVIVATPKQKLNYPGAPTKIVYQFDQKDGYLVKMVTYATGDKPLTTMTFSEVKLDVDIDPSRFVFEVPEGVEVLDQTRPKP